MTTTHYPDPIGYILGQPIYLKWWEESAPAVIYSDRCVEVSSMDELVTLAKAEDGVCFAVDENLRDQIYLGVDLTRRVPKA